MKKIIVLLVISSLLVTLLLFFIDKGNYHFKGLFNVGNIVALSFYFIGIFVTKLILLSLFRPKLSTRMALPVTILTGSVLGSFIVAGFFVYGIPALRAIG